ncbi:MAG: alpha/beta hydrolase [Flavobacteriales bacterium]|nr:alpha/beta hydrolase [Flavobacteriales bacterium]MDW8432229.1 alpha/beta hydrolase [Flavobacteriales bacterium]
MALAGKIFESEVLPRLDVVLLHGLGESSSVWAPLAVQVSSRWPVRVFAPDLPGAGASRYFEAVQLKKLDFFAEELQNWLVEKQVRQPAVWVGHSMGGYVALAVARRFPSWLAGLFLFHSTPEADSEEKKRKREQSIRIFRHNPELYLREFYRNLFAQPEAYEREIEVLMKYGLGLDPDHFTATLEALRDRADSRDLWRGLPIPKAILAGRWDPLLDVERLKDLAKEAGAHFFEAGGSAHMAMIEEPSVTLEAVERFLSEILQKS